jgi:hypothetical protein
MLGTPQQRGIARSGPLERRQVDTLAHTTSELGRLVRLEDATRVAEVVDAHGWMHERDSSTAIRMGA